MVGWLTDKTGLFAAVVAAVGLLAALFAIVRPMVENRRKTVKGRPSLAVTTPDYGELSRSSRSRELRFQIVNSGGGTCVVQSVRLIVEANGKSDKPRRTVTEAPLVVHKHRVELRPDRTEYDIRARAFGPALPPIGLGEGEAEAFVVKLVAHVPQWYDVRLTVEWYDTATPHTPRTVSTAVTRLDFPPSLRESSKDS